MTTIEDWGRAVLEHPEDEALRLMLGDWFDERGEAALAQELRRPGVWWLGCGRMWWATPAGYVTPIPEGRRVILPFQPNNDRQTLSCQSRLRCVTDYDSARYWSKSLGRWCCNYCLPDEERIYEEWLDRRGFS